MAGGTNMRLFLLALTLTAITTPSLAQDAPAIDQSGKGAVLCAWSIYTTTQTIRDTCQWERTPADDAIDTGVADIEAFIIKNSAKPVTPEQLALTKQDAAADLVQAIAATPDMCTANRQDQSPLALLWAMRTQEPADLTAQIADLLSVPREPVMNPSGLPPPPPSSPLKGEVSSTLGVRSSSTHRQTPPPLRGEVGGEASPDLAVMSPTEHPMSEWIISTITQWSYLGIFLLMVAENIFPPIPSELIMPFAGFAAANGDLNVFGVLIAGVAGSLVGTLAWYIVSAPSRAWSASASSATGSGASPPFREDDIDKAVHWFDRYGPWAVLIGRLMPAIRTLISVPAGLAAMNFGKFLAVSAVGTALWTAILTAAGSRAA